MRAFKIHPQIEADSAYVMDLELCQVRLHNNAAFPWLMLIPDTDVIELVDQLSLSVQGSTSCGIVCRVASVC